MLGIFDLHDFIEHDILPELAGDLDGCGGWLINTIPTEMDCNAAASVYIANRFSSTEVQAIRDSPRRFLACSLLPPPLPETLPARMIAFIYLHRGLRPLCGATRFPRCVDASNRAPRRTRLLGAVGAGLVAVSVLGAPRAQATTA